MSRKLTLDPDSLSVESFHSGRAAEELGTVQANVKAPCPISGAIAFSCPNSWDCRVLDAPLPARG